MRVFLNPVGLHSRAMVRVANALIKYKPEGVHIVNNQQEADMEVFHVIGYPETLQRAKQLREQKKDYAIIQYCLRTTQEPGIGSWIPIWADATCVWSYYDLPKLETNDLGVPTKKYNFYHAPLGLDDAFRAPIVPGDRWIGAMTSGYVNHPAAEAIEEVALAMKKYKLPVTHIGPAKFAGRSEVNLGDWSACIDITDQQLASLYSHARWVSGLRHGEGFEMPALEGLACGARPIMFDRPDMWQWYEGHAAFVPECHGQELIDRLIEIFKEEPRPVTVEERSYILDRFNWKPICEGFWNSILEQMESWYTGKVTIDA